jgi:hypothetical protein
MSDSSIMRVFATDPRISNPKPVEMHTNAMLFVQDGFAHAVCSARSELSSFGFSYCIFDRPV